MTTPSDMKAYNQSIIDEFRANGRRAGTPRLLLTTIGARSGNRHTVPLGYQILNDRLVVYASMMGAPKHPAWYHNLVARPRVTVEMDGGEWSGTATPLTGDDYDAMWQASLREWPFLADHQAKTSRRIPIVQLTRG